MNIILNEKNIRVKLCNKFNDRLVGMMLKKDKLNYGLCFPNCNSIHTFFMLQTIDVIMTDKNNKIIYIKKNLKPWKIILPKKNVYYTYEFSKDLIGNVKINDYIKKKS